MVFQNLGYKIEDYPVSYDNYSREISLPIYPQLTNEQVDYICEVVLTSYNNVLVKLDEVDHATNVRFV